MIFYVRKNGIGIIATIVYHLFLSFCCFKYIREDYASKLLSVSKQITGRNIFHQILRGIGYGSAYAILLFVICSFPYQLEFQKYQIQVILLQIIIQLIIAFAEELFFRYYFFETLCAFKVPANLSVIFISLIFGVAHLATNQTLLVCIFVTIFSIFLFYLRLSKHKESYLTLTLCHYTYNLYFTFIFVTSST